MIVSAGHDGALKLWETATGKVQKTLVGHRSGVTTCAVSPDGMYIYSGSYDYTLKVWGRQSGQLLATLPLLGDPHALAVDPARPYVVCGDTGGQVYFAEAVGVTYQAIVVTAEDAGRGPMLRCPRCQLTFPAAHSATCPRKTCGQRLSVNRFVLNTRLFSPPASRARRGWWPFGRKGE